MHRTMALILAGGASPALSVLAAERAEAAIAFAGKYRIIDFTLSNCINSAIYNVGVLTQHYPRSLHAHLGVGRPWDLDRAQGGLRTLHPSPTPDGGGWQRGTADAVRYNMNFLAEQPDEDILLLAGDHIYKMDYRPLIETHREHRADITLAVHSVSPHEARRYGIVSTDPNGLVTDFVEKPKRPTSGLASMGIYIVRKEFLLRVLSEIRGASFGSDVLPQLVGKTHMQTYTYQGYWMDVGTVQAYYEANMAMLTESPPLDMYDQEWVVHTASSQRPAAAIASTAHVENSLLSDGCRVEGTVIRSVVSPGAYVAPGATVRDSIVLHDVQIGENAVVDHCIIDEFAKIGAGTQLGTGSDNTPNSEHPDWLNTSISLVGTRAHVPADTQIGRNVVIRPRTSERAFGANRAVASGTTLA